MQPKSARTKLADTYITAIEENPFNLQKADAEFQERVLQKQTRQKRLAVTESTNEQSKVAQESLAALLHRQLP